MGVRRPFYLWGLVLHELGNLERRVNSNEIAAQAAFDKGVSVGLWSDARRRYVRPLGHPEWPSTPVINHHETDDDADPILRDTLRLLKNNFEVIRGEVTALDGHKTGTPRDSDAGDSGVRALWHDEGESLHSLSGSWRMIHSPVTDSDAKHAMRSCPKPAHCFSAFRTGVYGRGLHRAIRLRVAIVSRHQHFAALRTNVETEEDSLVIEAGGARGGASAASRRKELGWRRLGASLCLTTVSSMRWCGGMARQKRRRRRQASHCASAGLVSPAILCVEVEARG